MKTTNKQFTPTTYAEGWARLPESGIAPGAVFKCDKALRDFHEVYNRLEEAKRELYEEAAQDWTLKEIDAAFGYRMHGAGN